MKHNPKSPFNTFEECPNCGALWRVMKDGRIDFSPRSPAMHHVCTECMKKTVAKAEAILNPKPAPKRKAPAKKPVNKDA